jgi:hypothetical protein
VLRPGGLVGDLGGADRAGQSAREQGVGVAAGEVAGQVLEVRSEDLGVEGRSGLLPRLLGEALLDCGGLREGDELVEADDRVGEGDDGVLGAEDVLFPPDVASGFQDSERVSDGVARALQGGADLARGSGALCDRSEDVVVQRVLRDPRVLAQQVLGLSTRVHRPPRIEQRPG